MGSKRLTIGSRAVAVAVLTEAIRGAEDTAGRTRLAADELAELIVAEAWDVEYRPNAEKLILTISAGIEAPDRMRSTPEDQDSAPCPYISNGAQCVRGSGHRGNHAMVGQTTGPQPE